MLKKILKNVGDVSIFVGAMSAAMILTELAMDVIKKKDGA